LLADKRYKPTMEVPEQLMSKGDDSSSFSIKGSFTEGRPLYLDMQVL
jgi:hypothetical protein